MCDKTDQTDTAENENNQAALVNLKSFEHGRGVFTWGSNVEGQVGGECWGYYLEIYAVRNFLGTPVVKVACGASFTVVLCVDGSTWSWGDNTSGQLGKINTNPKTPLIPGKFVSVPQQIWTDKQTVDIACGDEHALFVDQQGTVFGCGSNRAGQLNWGKHNSKNQSSVQLPTKCIAVACGYDFSMALDKDRYLIYKFGAKVPNVIFTPHACKLNSEGKLIGAKEPQKGDEIVQMSGAATHGACITARGDMYLWGETCWTSNLKEPAYRTFDLSNADLFHCAWSIENPVSSVTCSYEQTYAVSNGKVFLFTKPPHGQPKPTRPVDTINPVPTQLTVLNGLNIRKVAVPKQHHLNFAALTTDGSLCTWGFGPKGQLATGGRDQTKSPSLVKGIRLLDVEAGSEHLCGTQFLSKSSFAQNMAQAINQKAYSDIELISNDGQAIHAHRVILKARAPLLYASIQDSQSVRLDLSSKALSYLLHYLYGGVAPSDETSSLSSEIKAFAEKYQLPSTLFERIPEKSIFKAFYNQPEFSDVKFQIGSALFHAHKVILCARSSHFAAMLGNPSFAESSQEVVKLSEEEISEEAFGALLEFMYCDTTEIHSENVMELLHHASFYSLNHLFEICEEFIEENIDPDNVLEILKQAYALTAISLTAFCLNYLTKNGEALFIIKDSWEEIKEDIQWPLRSQIEQVIW